MFPYQREVSSKYGAPMGRQNTCQVSDLEGLVHLRRIPMIDGDYDQGGAYWGGVRGSYMFCAWNNEDEVYFRAPNRKAAKKALYNCRFYR